MATTAFCYCCRYFALVDRGYDKVSISENGFNESEEIENEISDNEFDSGYSGISGNDLFSAVVSGNGNDYDNSFNTGEYCSEMEITESESTLSTEILSNQTELITAVNSLNSTMAVLLFFTIFVWIEKKIKNATKKVVSGSE